MALEARSRPAAIGIAIRVFSMPGGGVILKKHRYLHVRTNQKNLTC
jgi:hypothetical protein